MLSSRFAVRILPESCIQRAIANWARAAAVTGGILILLQPLPVWLAILLSMLWLSGSLYAASTRPMNRRPIRELHCRPEQSWRALFDNGIWGSVERLPGSRVGAGLLWLYCRDDSGRRYGLLLRRRACRAEDWRRLQVILRLPPA